MTAPKAPAPPTPDQGLSAYQIFALVALACLNMQDGFDILAISFAANAIAESWQIGRASLGFVLSASLFGMMIGAMVLSPLADRIGRKPLTMIGLALSGIGMLIAMAAPSLNVLMIGRALTGFGVGGILASLNTLVAEFAGEKYRGQAVALFQLGFPLGAFFSGFIVAWLLDIGSWRHVFAFGAATSFVFIPIMLLLPESMDFIAKRGRPDALTHINHIRAKFGLTPLAHLPEPDPAAPDNPIATVTALFTPRYFVRTALIWVAFFLLLTVLYFMLSWAPKLLTDMGFSQSQGNLGGRLINLTGMGGIVLIGLLSHWLRPSLVTSVYLVLLAGCLLALSTGSSSFTIMLVMISAIGFVIHGSMIGLYATTPALYPAHMRATGMGWAIGLSRFGAVLGPAIAGILLEAGWTPAQLFQIYAVPALLAALIVCLLWRDERRRAGEIST